MGIYVEIPIRAAMDELWEKTQNPDLHGRWDLRFSQIEYLPREGEEQQRFFYRTRIGFGLSIDGEGESVGTRNGEAGERTSSLKFWSDDRKSLIKTGSGYWKYVPIEGAIRFFTWYDYETRFGWAGRLLDKIFRPLLGWATAWSFDALRLWLEKGIPPEASRDKALVYSVARGLVAFIWFYHGLVPKLLYYNHIELDLLSRVVSSPESVRQGTALAGAVEIVFALVLLFLWRSVWPLWVTLILMVAGIPVVAVTAPEYFTAAFNPLTLNLSVAGFALISIIMRGNLPSASRCARKPPKENS
jgi:DoxX-like family